ncbi:BTAD domain-containing putative transcriptional regulator [Spongiactinospora sp. 9N601]|uniref:AfsR/SARP family transcriptional regulator n=1 Tax=Spongiactinospora sp. 9N601 TaxID=3375149 RepID=UPI0037B3928F
MDYLVLGPLAVQGHQGVDLTPTPPKVREVLALLLLRNQTLVLTSELIDELWPDNPPVSALSTLQTYIYKLRNLLSSGNDERSAILRTRPHGYMLAVPPEHIDSHHFERLMGEGQAALAADDPGTAADRLAQALSLWRGPALADVTAGSLLSAYATALEESRLRALELRVDVDLRLGRHRKAISELKTLVGDYPLHEEFHVQLMLALQRSGRRPEALDVYQRLRGLLVEELGVEPSSKAQATHQALLSSEDTLEVPIPAITVTTASRGDRTPDEWRPVAPAQLPPDMVGFTSRSDALDKLLGALVEPRADSTPVVAVGGMPGVGKTVLAVHAAHTLRQSYPDGQLFAQLGGSTSKPADPADILGDFLTAAGVPEDRIPVSLDGRIGAFRTWTAKRQVLVVLDDAASAAQVQPLLPGCPPSAAIVTGRAGLGGLASAVHLQLDLPSTADGVELLQSMIGRTLTGGETRAAELIVQLCGNLPLAIRAVGGRLSATSWPLKKLAERLIGATRRLDEVIFADMDVRDRLLASYRRLSEEERHLLRLLSLLPSPVFTSHGVAKLLQSDSEMVDGLLLHLVENHFVRVLAQNADEIVYTFHELVRFFAQEQVERELSYPEDSEEEETMELL